MEYCTEYVDAARLVQVGWRGPLEGWGDLHESGAVINPLICSFLSLTLLRNPAPPYFLIPPPLSITHRGSWPPGAVHTPAPR